MVTFTNRKVWDWNLAEWRLLPLNYKVITNSGNLMEIGNEIWGTMEGDSKNRDVTIADRKTFANIVIFKYIYLQWVDILEYIHPADTGIKT